MNIFNRVQQNNNNPNVQAELEMRAIFGNISGRMDNLEIRSLIYLLELIQDSTALATNRHNIAIPQKDHNITTAIFEKCLAIKKKNYSLKLRILNLRTSLTHQMHAQRRTGNLDHRYQEVLDEIKQKSASLSKKIQQYKGCPLAKSRFTNTELIRSEPVKQLEDATEWLQRELIKIRREFDLVFKTSTQQTNRDF